jgi:predicted NUDIX family phosphoesterase
MPTVVTKVLCTPAATVARIMAAGDQYPDHGSARYVAGYEQDAILSRLLGTASYEPRTNVETDPSFKQLIPYVIIHSGGLVFRYTRAKGGTETRLHDLYSIGVGGHIEPQDIGTRGFTRRGVEAALVRELHEEVELTGLTDIRFQMLVDFNDGVGLYHVGLVYTCEMEWPEVRVRETASLADGKFIPVEQAIDDIDNYEAWSRLALLNYEAWI